MSKKNVKNVKDVQQMPEAPKIGINPGNIDILKVKLLGDISNYLKRIAEALEQK